MSNLPERKEENQRGFVVEVGKIYPTAAEKEGLVKRTEIPDLTKPVTHLGQVLVTSPAAEKPKIILPVSRAVYLNPVNWKRGVNEAISWLLATIKRVIKMNPDKVAFRNP
jgi:hypothetical protein